MTRRSDSDHETKDIHRHVFVSLVADDFVIPEQRELHFGVFDSRKRPEFSGKTLEEAVSYNNLKWKEKGRRRWWLEGRTYYWKETR